MNTKSLIMEYVTMRTYQKESWVGWSAETMNLISNHPGFLPLPHTWPWALFLPNFIF